MKGTVPTMAVKAPITVEGRLGRDPELKHTEDGRPYTRMLIMENHRQFNDDTREWEDVGEPIMHSATVFGQQAENVAASLHTGSNVVVSGDLQFRVYEKDGERRQSTQIVAKSVAASLRYNEVEPRESPKAPSPEVDTTGPVAEPATATAPPGPSM